MRASTKISPTACRLIIPSRRKSSATCASRRTATAIACSNFTKPVSATTSRSSGVRTCMASSIAAPFATHGSWPTFLIGLAASVGAGISMGFAEALSDDGSLTGRGHPWARGFVCGAMTTLGGIGHTLPYLIPNVKTATSVAVCVVLVELGVISWVRHKFMDTPLSSAVLQVVLGGVLVFLVGILIGSS